MARAIPTPPAAPPATGAAYPPGVVEEARRTFVPATGNPENGDYLDWYRHLEKTAAAHNQERP